MRALKTWKKKECRIRMKGPTFKYTMYEYMIKCKVQPVIKFSLWVRAPYFLFTDTRTKDQLKLNTYELHATANTQIRDTTIFISFCCLLHLNPKPYRNHKKINLPVSEVVAAQLSRGYLGLYVGVLFGYLNRRTETNCHSLYIATTYNCRLKMINHPKKLCLAIQLADRLSNFGGNLNPWLSTAKWMKKKNSGLSSTIMF